MKRGLGRGVKKAAVKLRTQAAKRLAAADAMENDGVVAADTQAKLDALRRRKCVRKDCARTFIPSLTVSGQTTELHCGPECAMKSLAEREGWKWEPKREARTPENPPVALPAGSAQEFQKDDVVTYVGPRAFEDTRGVVLARRVDKRKDYIYYSVRFGNHVAGVSPAAIRKEGT